MHSSRPTPVPIPRPPSQIHRPANGISEASTPLSHSPSSVSSSSPFPLSPPTASPMPASYTSATTTLTTPPSSASLTSNPPVPYPGAVTNLSYPSVPPPSLSSSFGSPSTTFHINSVYTRRDGAAENGAFSRSHSQGHSRRASVERGARVAETGTLIPRGRHGRDESVQESPEEASSSSDGGTAHGTNGHI